MAVAEDEIVRRNHKFTGCDKRNYNLVPTGKTSSPKLKLPRLVLVVFALFGWMPSVLIFTIWPFAEMPVRASVNGEEDVVERDPRDFKIVP